MISGRDALRALDMAVAQARKSLAQAAAAAAARTNARADIDRRRARTLSELATLRLEASAAGQAPHAAALAAADRDAAALMDAHDDHVAGLEREAGDAEARVETLEAARRAAEEAVECAVAAYEDAAAEARDRLHASDHYRAAIEAVSDARATADRADAKHAVALDDRTTKGAPYEDDPLFTYLYERGRGTPAYKAGPITRLLDGWVAGLINYEEARLNYHRLTDLPDRLAEHAARMHEAVSGAERALIDVEAAAFARDGVTNLKDAALAARAALDEVDRDLAEAEAAHLARAEAHAAAARGEDGPYAAARDRLADALGRQSPPDLRALAAETTTLADDALVDELVRLRAQELELEVQASGANASPDRYRAHLDDLERVRRRFTAQRYDGPYSAFDSEAAVAVALEDFRRGEINRDGLWRRLERAQRTRRPKSSRTRQSRGGRRGGWSAPVGVPGLDLDDMLGDVFDELDLDDVITSTGPRRSRRSRRPTISRSRPTRSRSRSRPRPRRGGGGFRTGGGF